jgi:ABC-type glycerol-3-phosphate transport system substrate-binding protein
MEMHAPIRVARNAFVYNIGIYRCTLELAERKEEPWQWEIAEYVPAPPQSGVDIQAIRKASGREETAEDALQAVEKNIARLEYYEQKETHGKYAG